MFVAGYATKQEIEELKKRGWEIEDAGSKGLVGPEGSSVLMTPPSDESTSAIVVFVDQALFTAMSGLDWDLGDQPLDVVQYQELKVQAGYQRAKLEAMFEYGGSVMKRCTHKYPDGTDASVGVPVSGERFCRTCGKQWD